MERSRSRPAALKHRRARRCGSVSEVDRAIDATAIAWLPAANGTTGAAIDGDGVLTRQTTEAENRIVAKAAIGLLRLGLVARPPGQLVVG